MQETVSRPPKTLLEVYQLLPEGTLCQLINNRLIISPSPSESHQKVLDKIYRKLGDFVEENELGITRVAPYDVYFNNENIYQPDIVYVSAGREHLIQSNGLHGAPDLVIEILTPSTAKADQYDKKVIYEHYGVKEYWLIEPNTKAVNGYYLINSSFIPVESSTGSFYSQLLQQTFKF